MEKLDSSDASVKYCCSKCGSLSVFSLAAIGKNGQRITSEGRKTRALTRKLKESHFGPRTTEKFSEFEEGKQRSIYSRAGLVEV